MKRYWPPFTYYFLYFVALAAFAPYGVLFWQSLGFTGPQIGILSFIPPVVMLLAAPLWTGLADDRHAHRLLLVVAIVGVAGIAAVVPLIRTFGAALIIAPLYAFFSAPIMSMSDAATMHSLLREGKPEMYGRVRVGGTLGWAIGAPLAGILVQAHGLAWGFWAYSVVMLIGLVAALRFTFPAETQRVSVWHGMREIARNREWVFFLLLGIVCGMGFASVNNYFFAYMAELGIGTAVAGLALTISTISEIPIMIWANRILGRFGSRGMLTLAVAATSIRLFLYAAFTAPGAILVLQLLNALTFPMFWIAGVAYASERAPKGMQASAQGLFGAATTGVGAALGGLLGGILLASVGGRAMYITFGFIVLVGLIVLSVLERKYK